MLNHVIIFILKFRINYNLLMSIDVTHHTSLGNLNTIEQHIDLYWVG
jgi:hypothetical protein